MHNNVSYSDIWWVLLNVNIILKVWNIIILHPLPNFNGGLVKPSLVLWHGWVTWWRHQMETFSALLAICAGNSPVSGEFPTQRPVTRSFDIFFDLRLNKRLSKQSWGWWFETLSCPLWRQCNDYIHRNMVVNCVVIISINPYKVVQMAVKSHQLMYLILVVNQFKHRETFVNVIIIMRNLTMISKTSITLIAVYFVIFL